MSPWQSSSAPSRDCTHWREFDSNGVVSSVDDLPSELHVSHEKFKRSRWDRNSKLFDKLNIDPHQFRRIDHDPMFHVFSKQTIRLKKSAGSTKIGNANHY